MELSYTYFVAAELRAAKARSFRTNVGIAEFANLSPSTISKILTGDQPIDLDRVDLIARACGTTGWEILIAAAEAHTRQK